MRKVRQRALKARVQALAGRPVNRTVIVESTKEFTKFVPSEWRRIKKAYNESVRSGATHG